MPNELTKDAVKVSAGPAVLLAAIYLFPGIVPEQTVDGVAALNGDTTKTSAVLSPAMTPAVDCFKDTVTGEVFTSVDSLKPEDVKDVVPTTIPEHVKYPDPQYIRFKMQAGRKYQVQVLENDKIAALLECTPSEDAYPKCDSCYIEGTAKLTLYDQR
jgi:hypothetical protein